MGDQLTHPDPPDPSSHIALTTPPAGALPHGEEGVLHGVGDQCIVEAARTETGGQPRDVTVVQATQGSYIVRCNSTHERCVVELGEPVARSHRFTFAPGGHRIAHVRYASGLIDERARRTSSSTLSLATTDRDHDHQFRPHHSGKC
jgi:hypothetical protein